MCLGMPWLLMLAAAATAAAPPDSAPALVRVQFVVSTPAGGANDPDTIFVILGVDGWNEAGRALPRVAPGLYAASWEFPGGQPLEYKFARTASWKSVEKGAGGAELPNRDFTVPGDVPEAVRIHSVARWADVDPASRHVSQADAPAASLTGDIRRHEQFASPELKDERTILVALPEGYDKETGRRYPVLYMHDGQNVFDQRTSFTGVEWGADEAAARLRAAGRIAPIIVVAVYNDSDRRAEYTPFADRDYQGGNGAAYLAFLTQTLKPFIDRTYRTDPRREATGLCGSSLGGLISLYAAARHSDVFSRVAAVSPSLWWAERRMLALVEEAGVGVPVRLWVDMGTQERGAGPDSARFVADLRALETILRGKGLTDANLRVRVFENAPHNEAAWAERFPEILEFLYADTAAPAGGGTATTQPADSAGGR